MFFVRTDAMLELVDRALMKFMRDAFLLAVLFCDAVLIDTPTLAITLHLQRNKY
jgi:hypothetical protein